MDQEKRARRQSLRIIISEVFMVIAVAITVLILALIVSGYWLNSNFEVERQGLLQIYSVPTGADIEIDGVSSWLQRTNTSKTLASGEHTVVLTKEGYDSWSKTINISEGLLYRLHYPRLFLKDREKETVYDASSATYATVSPNRKLLLVANQTTNWDLLNIDNDKIGTKKIDLSQLLPAGDASSAGIFNGEIISSDWDANNEHLLMKIKSNAAVVWLVIDIKNPKNSIDVSKEFGTDFSDLKIFDQSSSNLLGVRDDDLYRIDLSNRQVSAILVNDIVNFDYYDQEIVFVAKQEVDAFVEIETDQFDQYYLGIKKIGDDNIEELAKLDRPDEVAISRFYDKKYITVLEENSVTVYQKEDFSESFTSTTNFIPNQIKVGNLGEFIVFGSQNQLATLDMEAMKMREWNIASDHYGWIDDNMIYFVSNGVLNVCDFDGFNCRQLAQNVSKRLPATITSDKWLYYFSDDQLVREWLIKK